MARDQQKLFSLRTDNPEGQEFLEALDLIREQDKPTPTRSDVVRRLVFREAGKIAGAKLGKRK